MGNTNHEHRIQVMVNAEILERLTALQEELKCSQSKAARFLIEQAIEQELEAFNEMDSLEETNVDLQIEKDLLIRRNHDLQEEIEALRKDQRILIQRLGEQDAKPSS